MAKIIFFALTFLIAATLLSEVSSGGECPFVNEMDYSDHHQHSGDHHQSGHHQHSGCHGKKSCHGSHHTKSCSEGSLGCSGTSEGMGTHCDNVRCSAHEKCTLDSSTNRMKCVRA